MPVLEQPAHRIRVRPERRDDRPTIESLRHEVYAVELGQHPVSDTGRLRDRLDDHNLYLVAEAGGRVVGFISITPPTAPSYSVEKYLDRGCIPVEFDKGLFEVRILTVAREHRRGPAAVLLMRAAMKAVREAGGRMILIMGRREVADLYKKVGLRPLGISFDSGRVTYDLMAAAIDDLEATCMQRPLILGRVERALGDDETSEQARHAAGLGAVEGRCDHGGAFFGAIGAGFDDLSRRHTVVNADVLDAWFPPAPGVREALTGHLDWLLATSPPTHADGLVRAIGTARGIPEENIVIGSGSSSLIFLALRHWLGRGSNALVLDPMYAEYEHVLGGVIGCGVHRFKLDADEDFRINEESLARELARGYDLVAMVNPNNPTGQHVPRERMERLLARAHPRTRVWIDEAYVDYTGDDQSLERLAAASRNVIVCKSMSKGYALSGARAAYLAAPASIAAELRAITPPWAVSLPAQVAAVRALADPAYYRVRREQTHALREQLIELLRPIAPWRIITGVINSVLCLLPDGMPGAAAIVGECRRDGVFVRDCSTISPGLGDRAVRVSVKDEATNPRVAAALDAAVRRARAAAEPSGR